MYMIEITEDKATKMSESIEKALKYMGKAMQCIDEIMSESEMGEREMGERGNFGQGGARAGYGGGAYASRANYRTGPISGGGSYGSRALYREMDDDDDDDVEERRRRRR